MEMMGNALPIENFQSAAESDDKMAVVKGAMMGRILNPMIPGAGLHHPTGYSTLSLEDSKAMCLGVLNTNGIGVRLEGDVLVTEDGCEVLSARVPKTIEEIEGVMRGAHLGE